MRRQEGSEDALECLLHTGAAVCFGSCPVKDACGGGSLVGVGFVLTHWLPWNEHGGRPEGQQLRPSGSYSPCSRTSERGAFVALASRQRSIRGIFTPQYSHRCGLAKQLWPQLKGLPGKMCVCAGCKDQDKRLKSRSKKPKGQVSKLGTANIFSLNLG